MVTDQLGVSLLKRAPGLTSHLDGWPFVIGIVPSQKTCTPGSQCERSYTFSLQCPPQVKSMAMLQAGSGSRANAANPLWHHQRCTFGCVFSSGFQSRIQIGGDGAARSMTMMDMPTLSFKATWNSLKIFNTLANSSLFWSNCACPSTC